MNVRAFACAALLVLAPLPFGGALAPFATCLLVATAALLAASLARGVLAVFEPSTFRSALAIAAIGLLGLVQSMPWPIGAARVIAPRLVEIERDAATLLGTEGELRFTPLSLAPEASRDASFDWFLPAIALAAAVLVGTDRRSRRTMLWGILAAGVAQIALGVQLWISRSDSLWGVSLTGFPGRVRGSFVNPNHLALLLEIALAAAFAWLAWSIRRSWSEGDGAEARLFRVGLPALAVLLLFSGLALTGSRAGILAGGVALTVQGYLFGRRRGRKWMLGASALAAAAGLAFVLLSGLEGSLSRLAATPLDDVSGSGRLRAASAALDLWEQSPITGVGLGAFRASFPLVQPESLPGVWRHAHNDWIELLATTGLVGVALVGVALFFYLRRLRRVILHGESSEDRAAGIAAAGALVAVGLHSLVDFGLTIPANAFALAVVAGAGAVARVKEENRSRRSERERAGAEG